MSIKTLIYVTAGLSGASFCIVAVLGGITVFLLIKKNNAVWQNIASSISKLVTIINEAQIPIQVILAASEVKNVSIDDVIRLYREDQVRPPVVNRVFGKGRLVKEFLKSDASFLQRGYWGSDEFDRYAGIAPQRLAGSSPSFGLPDMVLQSPPVPISQMPQP